MAMVRNGGNVNATPGELRVEQIGTMEMSVVKTLPIMTDPHSVRTVGAFVDEMLTIARENGDRVSQLTVKLEEKFW